MYSRLFTLCYYMFLADEATRRAFGFLLTAHGFCAPTPRISETADDREPAEPATDGLRDDILSRTRDVKYVFDVRNSTPLAAAKAGVVDGTAALAWLSGSLGSVSPGADGASLSSGDEANGISRGSGGPVVAVIAKRALASSATWELRTPLRTPLLRSTRRHEGCATGRELPAAAPNDGFGMLIRDEVERPPSEPVREGGTRPISLVHKCLFCHYEVQTLNNPVTFFVWAMTSL